MQTYMDHSRAYYPFVSAKKSWENTMALRIAFCSQIKSSQMTMNLKEKEYCVFLKMYMLKFTSVDI